MIDILTTYIEKEIKLIKGRDVNCRSSNYWFNCYGIKIRTTPSFGYISIQFDFNETKDESDFVHKIIIKETELINDNLYGFKYDFDKTFITKTIKQFGFRYNEMNGKEIELYNEILLISEKEQILIVPEYSTARTMFTTDLNTIERYLNDEYMNYKDAERFIRIEK